MKKPAIVLFILSLSLTALLSSCSSSENAPPEEAVTQETDSDAPGEVKVIDKNLSATITVWAGDEYDTEFNKVYPNIKVEHVGGIEKVNQKFLTTIATGSGAPDVYQVGDGSYMTLKLVGGLENLLAPPYNAGQYKSKYNETLWNVGLSFDGKSMFALPQYMDPYVMYYRADIMEANGYPSDPDEFGKFVADPDNFFKMATELRAKGIYFFKHAREVTDLANPGEMFFDDNFAYVRNTDTWEKAIDFAKRAVQLDLIFPGNDDERKQALVSGKVVTFFDNTSSMGAITENNQEEQKGKWRATTNPFGKLISRKTEMYVIPSQSKNKEAAWAWVQFATNSKEAALEMYKKGRLPGNKDFWTLPEIEELGKIEVLGGQNILKLAISMMDKVQFAKGNPLDDQSRTLWNSKVNEAIENSKDSRTTLNQMQGLIEKTFAKDIETYKAQAGIK